MDLKKAINEAKQEIESQTHLMQAFGGDVKKRSKWNKVSYKKRKRQIDKVCDKYSHVFLNSINKGDILTYKEARYKTISSLGILWWLFFNTNIVEQLIKLLFAKTFGQYSAHDGTDVVCSL
jgi:hypothetical protein